MFEKVADSISGKVCVNAGVVEQEKQEIVQYGISTVLSLALTIVVIWSIAACLGIIAETMLVLAGSLGLRFLTGGHHSKTFGGCLFVSIVVFPCLGYIAASYGGRLSLYGAYPVIASALICLPLVWLYAPVGVSEKPIVSERQRKLLRRLAMGYLTIVYSSAIILAACWPAFLLGMTWQSMQLTSLSDLMLKKVDRCLETMFGR